jgi:putative nucleotidyltransferase with HDIG domain
MSDAGSPSTGQEPGATAARATRLIPTIAAAQNTTTRLLHANPGRLHHSEAVAARARNLSITVPDSETELLIAAAWLHDIGYASALHDTGFHPLDGARYLRETGWDDSLCALVAHHSGARYVATGHGLTTELAEFPFRPGPVADALTVADQTTGPDGQHLTIDERMRDMLQRHGPDSPNAHAHRDREPYIRAAAARVIARLQAAGGDDEGRRITNAQGDGASGKGEPG